MTTNLRITCLCALLSAAFAANASPATAENAKLRAQIEQLKSQLEAAQSNCTATAAPAAVPAAAVATAPAAATPAAVPVPAAVANAPVAEPSVPQVFIPPTAAATPAPSTAKPAPAVPEGYRLVKIEPIVPKDDRWQDVHAWEALSRGMSMPEVQASLGPAHAVTTANGRTFWGYGKISGSYAGKVIFVDGKLAVWTQPDF